MLSRHKIQLMEFITSLKMGWFLAYRDIKRANIWTTLLIVAVMVLTFLNLVVVAGILVGLIQGSEDAYKQKYLGDIILTTPLNERYIKQSQDIIKFIRSLPEVEAVSPRYSQSSRLEANYKTRTNFNDPIESTGAVAMGIDPIAEDKLGNLSKYVIEGEYLEAGDYDQVLVGANLLYKYLQLESSDMPTLKNVETGSVIRLKINGLTREVTVKGVIKTKVDLDQRVFMVDSQFRNLVNRYDYNVGEIAVRLKPGVNADKIRDVIINNSPASLYAKVQTAQQAQPKFVNDMKKMFALLGNMIGSIGLAVSSITIFIVIFVNAITRRRYIGILKGIGISSWAIECSYIIQSLFYALLGMTIGSAIIFLILEPLMRAYPIDFPFSDGILVVTVVGVLIRGGVLFVATIIAGYIPARIVVKQNTLNAILGR